MPNVIPLETGHVKQATKRDKCDTVAKASSQIGYRKCQR